MNEIQNLKDRYARQIEDGRKIEVFTSMPEWQWYVESVIKPTIEDYTERILNGKIQTDKEDWVIRGMIMGMRQVIGTTSGFKEVGKEAKNKAKALEEEIKNG